MTGYVRVTDVDSDGCEISVPNQDVSMIVKRIIDEIDQEDSDLFVELKRMALDHDV